MTDQPLVYAWWVRVTHWINAVAVGIMLLSGWRIYDATDFMGFHIPNSLTLGGWLGGAIEWHFAAMWLLGANGLIYLCMNLVTLRLVKKFFPLSVRTIFRDLKAALQGNLKHDDLASYNAVQKLAYLFAIIDIVLLVASGLVLWKSVQFPILRDALFGYEGARRIHFIAMAGLVGFTIVHVVMVVLVPKTFVAMVRGRP